MLLTEQNIIIHRYIPVMISMRNLMVLRTHASIVWIGKKMTVNWSRFFFNKIFILYNEASILCSLLNNLHQNSTAPPLGCSGTHEDFIETSSKFARKILVERPTSIIIRIATPRMRNATLPAPLWQSPQISNTMSTQQLREQADRSSSSFREKSKWFEKHSWRRSLILVKHKTKWFKFHILFTILS